MARLRRLFAAAAIMLCAICSGTQQSSAAVPAPKWEQESIDRDAIRDSSEADRPEVTVRDGYIYITTAREVDVKVFTILGQPVAQRKLQPGTIRLLLPAKGIYILKAGDMTRRLNI